MRCLLYLLLCVALSSCLKRPSRGIKPPREAGTSPNLDGSAGTGTPSRLIFDPHKTVTPITEEHERREATKPTESTEKPHDTSTGGGKLVVNTPAASDATQLNAVVLTALCNNCLYPIKNDATELQCKIEGCREGWKYVTHSTAPQHQHSQSLCGRGDKTVADLSGLRLKCQFTHKKPWWLDYKHSDEFVLSKAIVTSLHLCVITEATHPLSSDHDVHEVSIVRKTCDDHSLSDKKHKLALSFGW